MAEDNQRLIELPDDEELFRMAQAAVQGRAGTDAGAGELHQWDDDDPRNAPIESAPASSPRRTPIHGAVAYMRVPLSMAVYHGFAAYDEARRRKLGDALYQVSESDRMAAYLEMMVGHSILADDKRSDEEKIYFFQGLYRGQTFQELVAATHVRDEESEWAQRAKLIRRQECERVRAKLGNEWTDERINEMLGPVSVLED